MEKSVECLPTLAVVLELTATALGIEWRLRHDLSPVDTSKVSRVLSGNEPICGENIEPAIVIEIGKGGAPTPPCHGGLSGRADVSETSI